MRLLFIIPAILFGIMVSACAVNTELFVTPSRLDPGNYKFSVAPNAKSTNQTITFHVSIKAKSAEIPAKSEANLVLIPPAKGGLFSENGGMRPFNPMVPIALNKSQYIWTADFTLPREALKMPGLSFVFFEVAYNSTNSQGVALPSVGYYEIKLKDFVKE